MTVKVAWSSEKIIMQHMIFWLQGSIITTITVPASAASPEENRQEEL